jgi:two-component system cell cycle sensor histidine kinase/response regulator CckA
MQEVCMIEDRAVLNAVRDAIFLADIDTGMILDANPAAEALCGRSLAELRLLHHTRLHPPERAGQASSSFQRHAQYPTVAEGLLLHKDGHQIPVEISSSQFTAPDGRRTLVGVFRDITERTVAQEALRRSEERFRQVAESAGEFIWEVDAEGLYTYASPVVKDMLGYSPEEVVGKMHFYDSFIAETRDEMKKAAFAVFARQAPFRAFPNWNVRKDGCPVLLETSGLPMYDEEGNLLGYRGTDTDVTARKAAEDRLRATLESIGDGFLACDADWRFVYVNRQAERLLGVSKEELLGKSHWDIFPLTLGTALEREYRRAAAGEPRDFENFYEPRGRWFHLRCFPREGGGMSVYFQDITEQKEVEAALRQREALLRAITDSTPDPIFVKDLSSRILLANPATLSVMGKREDEVLGRNDEEIYDDLEVGRRMMAHDREVMESGRTKVKEVELPTRDGIRVFLSSKTPYRNAEGRVIGTIGIARDITERKQTERKLLQILAAVESTSDAIGISDAHGRHFYQNKAFTELFGYSSAEELEAAGGGPAVVHDPAVARQMFDTIQSGGSWRGELKMVTKDGRVFEAFERADAVKDKDGNVIGLIGVITDITERRQAEEALRRSEMIYRAIGESIDYGVWVCAPDGRNTYASESFLNLVGLTQEQCSSFGWGSVLHPDDADRTIAAWKECVRTEGWWDIEHRFRGVDGEWHPVLARGVPVRDEQGRITCWAGINLDIGTLKRAQESLRVSEAKAHATAAELQAIMDAAPAVIIIAHDTEGRVVGGNRTAHALLRQPPGSNLSKDTAYDDRAENFRLMRDGVELTQWEHPLPKVARTGQALRNYEVQVAFEDGASIDLLGNVVPLLDGNGNPQGAVAVLSDITERKKAERALRESEQQLASIYNTVRDVIFYLAVEPGDQFRFVSVNAAFLKVTGLSREAVVGKTVNEVIPAPSLTMAFEKYRQAVEEKTIVSWEETSDYPTGRLTGDVSIAPVFDHKGNCTHLVGSVHDITERKRAEAALRESEERFRTVADTAPVMIWLAGLDKLCTFFNKPWLEFTGRTSEQEMGDGWLSGVHPEDQGRYLATYSSAFDARLSFKMEYRLRRADGEYRWILDNGTPRYREGEFAGYIGSCIDVTEQKQVEEQLRSKQVQLMDSQRLAKVGSWELDAATGKLRWSDEMYRIYRVPGDAQPDFQMFLSRVRPKDRAIIQETLKKARSTHAPVGVEFRITLPDGEMRAIRSIVEAVRTGEDTVVRFAGATQDITEQVKATELLRESESRLKTAERMAHAGNWIFDVKTSRTSCSEGLYRILGLPRDHNPSYERVLQMMPPEDRGRVERWVKNCLSEKKGNLIEARIVRPNGDVRTVACMSEVLLDEDGSPEQMFGTCQDVTDARREQEESFARQKLESLGTLASGIAHDFNNLLGAVLAQTELAMAELAAGEDPDEELKGIRDVAIRGSEIVRQLMVYAGKEGEVLEPVNVSKAVEGMLGFLRVTVSKHATLLTDLDENLPPVKARAAQLRQIVMNLVVNASDAIKDPEGMIRVTTRCVTIGHDMAGATSQHLAPGEYVQLEVSDTGRGMSPETQAKVFDPFFTTKSAGRGLGLAVVQGIVRSLNGAIRVVSELNKGTTFEILLPCAEIGTAAAGDRVAEPDRVSNLSPKATVLIVEDEDPLRLAVAKMLGKAGFGVLGVANGSDAIEMLRARASEIDVILLDMTIPGAPSHEVLVEAAQVRPNLKVILTSAYSEEIAGAVLSGPQVCGFVRKPFEFGKLMQMLRTAIA